MTRSLAAPATETVAVADRHLRVGIVGGGQLARMTAMAGLQLGCEIVVLDRNAHGPASSAATRTVVGDWDHPADLEALAAMVDVVTLENEFVDAHHLEALEALGCEVRPSSRTIGLVQDKVTQKETLAEAGLPVPRFRTVNDPDEVLQAGDDFGWPLVLKTRRNGYDGKGNATLDSPADVADAWRSLGGDRGNGLYVEAFCPFVMELAVMITRGHDGQVVTYPLVETVQRDHICHIVRAPAAVSDDIRARALDIAGQAADAVQMVGSMGVELFLLADGALCVNELAPRVHNSGHYTLDACGCSQFENHVRAVCGWPLGPTSLRTSAAVMVNLLGAGDGAGRASGLDVALSVPNAHVHLYGKATSGPGRKLGHVTAVGATVADAEERARQCAAAISFGSQA